MLFQGSPILYQRRAVHSVQPPGSPYRFSACPHFQLATCNLSVLTLLSCHQHRSTKNYSSDQLCDSSKARTRRLSRERQAAPINLNSCEYFTDRLPPHPQFASLPNAQCTKPRARSYPRFLSQSSLPLLLMNSTAATQLRAARHNCGQLPSKMPATVIYLYLEISTCRATLPATVIYISI